MEDVHYMIENSSGVLVYRDRAIEALRVAKEMESKKKTLPIYEDEQTTRLVDIEKIKRKELKIIRVRVKGARIVWMEKDNAIKKGYITE